MQIINFRSILIISGFIAISAFASAEPGHYNILDYGANSNGMTLSTKAIQSAIDDCSESGGGTVWFPAGKYISGTIYLRSHVTLFLDAGAVLSGSRSLMDYPVTISAVRSYTDNYTDKSLIYGEDLEQIAITGPGTIDGNGASFEHNGPYKVRPYMIRIINCRKVQVREVNMINSPMWVQHYLACEDVTVSGITVNSRVNANNDGIDIDGCFNVRISDCYIVSGDDAIVLKSTLDRKCKNVTITNCVLSSDCNAFKMGTETNGGFENITLSNCTIFDTRLAALTLQIVDGGTLNRVSISNVTMTNVGAAIFIRLGNRARPYTDKLTKPGIGVLSDVIIDNVMATNVGKTGCSISGLPGHMAENISLSNIVLTFEGGGMEDTLRLNIPELPGSYPEHDMFGELPSYGFYCRHCRNLRFDNIELGYNKKDARPAIVCDDVQGLMLNSVKAEQETAAPVLAFSNVKNALIQACAAHAETETFLMLMGTASEHVSLIANDLHCVRQPVISLNNSSVFMEGNRISAISGKSDCPFVKCDPISIDDRKIRINTPADVRNKRLEIIRAIWGTEGIPDRSDVMVTQGIESPLNLNMFVSRVDKFEIPVNAPVTEKGTPVKDLAYLFIPLKRNNRLILLNPGHSCTLKATPANDSGIEATINGLLESGFDVLAVYMPHVSDTSCYLSHTDHCNVINTRLGPGDQPATYGLRFFIEPEIVSLNYITRRNNYKNINMVGLSGGGWTTNLLSAIDERISYSFSVAGSIPLYYRSGGSVGDIEQFLPELYRDIAGYPDLYVLGAYGKGRKQVQVLNRQDDCCFGQRQHDPEQDYDRDMKAFEKSVKEKLKALNAARNYYLVIDETSPNHQISAFTLNNVILKELDVK